MASDSKLVSNSCLLEVSVISKNIDTYSEGSLKHSLFYAHVLRGWIVSYALKKTTELSGWNAEADENLASQTLKRFAKLYSSVTPLSAFFFLENIIPSIKLLFLLIWNVFIIVILK